MRVRASVTWCLSIDWNIPDGLRALARPSTNPTIPRQSPVMDAPSALDAVPPPDAPKPAAPSGGTHRPSNAGTVRSAPAADEYFSEQNAGQSAVLPAIQSLTIFADHDEAGLNAAQACARRWQLTGREVVTPAGSANRRRHGRCHQAAQGGGIVNAAPDWQDQLNKELERVPVQYDGTDQSGAADDSESAESAYSDEQRPAGTGKRSQADDVVKLVCSHCELVHDESSNVYAIDRNTREVRHIDRPADVDGDRAA